MALTTTQRDRACGVLLGAAAGDALGAGYAPGAWTDGTAMAIAIAETAATGVDLRHEVQQDRIVQRWAWWARNANDVDGQTAAVLSAARRGDNTARTARAAATALHQRNDGNGSLKRTAPVALAYLDDEQALAEAARAISELTHPETDAVDACVLWCAAIRHAVLTGHLDARIGLVHLGSERSTLWAARLDAAEALPPAAFAADSGGAVAAVQAAWSAIVHTPVPIEDPADEVFRADHLRLALAAAVHTGDGTGAVAAIAGALLGAAYGASAVPSHWRLALHGWPGLRARGLIHLSDNIVADRTAKPTPYPYYAVEAAAAPCRHPHDERVWIGGVRALTVPRPYVPAEVDAIVSLYEVGDAALPAGTDLLDVRLTDREGQNANLGFVLLDTVRAIEQLRNAGRTVFVHGLQAVNRTPTVAALYGARRQGIDIDQALSDVLAVLPDADPASEFRAALHRLQPNTIGGAQ